MIQISNPHTEAILYYVPDENIMNDSEELCIRGSNLKYLNGEIVHANMKKIGNTILFP